MKSITNLIAPLTLETFFKENWMSKTHLQKGVSDRFKHLFSWERLNGLLDEHIYQLGFPDIRLVHNNKLIPESEIIDLIPSRRFGTVKKVSPQKVKDKCKNHATLVIDAVNRIDPILGRFANSLASEFGEKVQINMYCSWPGVQGFDVHYDLQEAFILQIEGSKDWEVYDSLGTNLPLSNTPLVNMIHPRNVPSIKCKLQKGDWLYLPRGVWHSAIANDEPSLHLTVGIYCKTQSDFLHWVIDEIIKDTPSLRKNLRSKSFLAGKPEDLETSMLGAVESLRQLLSGYTPYTTGFHAEMSLHSQHSNSSNKFNFPEIDVNKQLIQIDTMFYRPSTQKIEISVVEYNETIKVNCDDKVFIFNGDVINLINGLFNKTLFSGRQVLMFDEGLEWEDIEMMLSRLLEEKVIFIS